jgi:hypothetical protein
VRKSSKNRASIGLERLERRDLMAVSPLPPDINNPGVLTLAGNGANDYLEVRDTGRGGTDQVSWRTTQNGLWNSVNREVWKIEIKTYGGNDTVIYNMTGALTNGLYREVVAELGDGKDVFTATVNGNITGPSNLYGLHVIADGGNGDDRLTGTMKGDILGAGDLAFSFSGGSDAGVDFMNVFLTDDVDIAPAARFWSNMYGGAGNDNMQLHYRGEMDGHLLFDLEGEQDSDWVVADITLDAGSQGYLGGHGYALAELDGGVGPDNNDNDTVEFRLRNNAGGTMGGINVVLRGG